MNRMLQLVINTCLICLPLSDLLKNHIEVITRIDSLYDLLLISLVMKLRSILSIDVIHVDPVM